MPVPDRCNAFFNERNLTMPRINLSLATLHEIGDGDLAEAFLAGLRAIRLDCEKRPTFSKPRKLNIELAVEPQCDGEVCSGLAVSAKVKTTLPPVESGIAQCGLDRSGHIVFADPGDATDVEGQMRLAPASAVVAADG
jgi:hypothetical protein